MSKHTPGPWVEGEFCIESGWVEINAKGQDRLSVASATPANSHIYHGIDSRRDEETKANARLIAAAPELLEALERIARPHDCGCVPCTGQCRSQIALEIAVEEMQGLSRAAIAKATG